MVPAIFGIWVLTTVEGLSRFLPSFSASPPLTAGTPSEYQDTMSPEMVRVTGCVGVGRRFSLRMSLIRLRGASQPRSFWVELGLQPERLNCPRLSARSVQRVRLCPPLPDWRCPQRLVKTRYTGWESVHQRRKEVWCLPESCHKHAGTCVFLHCHDLLKNINVILGCGFPTKPSFADSQTLGNHSSFISILNH